MTSPVDLQRRVEAGRAVALVVVRHPRERPGLIGSVGWCGPSLDLVFSSTERTIAPSAGPNGRRRRSPSRPVRVLGELERPDLVRLELVITPDPQNGRAGSPPPRRPARAPMRTPVRRRFQRHRQDPCTCRRSPRGRPPRRVSNPSRPRSLKFRRHKPTVGVTHPLPRSEYSGPPPQQHDPRAHRLLLRRRCVLSTARSSDSSSWSYRRCGRATQRLYAKSLTNTSYLRRGALALSSGEAAGGVQATVRLLGVR